MKNYLLIIIALAAMGSSERMSIERLDGTSIETTALDDTIETLMAKGNVTGMGISIFNNNKPVYQKTFGFANKETLDKLQVDDLFYGASFSKAVFGYY
jgi:CubicO group peptidase (beta-lactamase class C family)